MQSQHTKTRLGRPIKILAAATVALFALAGCSSTSTGTTSSGSFTQVAQDPSSTITVWVDSTRLPAAQAFKKAYPKIPIKIVTYDGDANGSNSFQTKISLFNKAGSGWPDVVFSEELTDTGWATSGSDPFAAPLSKGIIPASTINNFAPGALDPCTVKGVAYCLRNDLAQNVLWYNKTLMDQFGYSVPKTWQQYEALGAKVAAEHPGYVLGSVGDSFASFVYFWASQCPANVLKGTVFSSNTSASQCTRMASLLDTMIANKSITTDALLTGTSYNTTYGAAKTLMTVGPSWYGVYLFKDALKVPDGQIAAANPLSWGSEKNYTGDVGGGTWWMSSHSKNIANAAKFMEYVTTSKTVQASAPTYPAYAPAAALWLANPANSSYFATDVSPAFKNAASRVWSGWSANGLVNQQQIWSQTVMPPVLKGATVTSTLPAWETEAQNLATTVGYTVAK